MPVSEAKKRANEKYTQKNYQSVLFRVKKGYKEELKSIAEAEGYSLNSFINEAIQEKIERLEKNGY